VKISAEIGGREIESIFTTLKLKIGRRERDSEVKREMASANFI